MNKANKRMLEEALTTCQYISSLIEQGAPKEWLPEPLTFLISLLSALLQTGVPQGWLNKEAGGLLEELRNFRDSILKGEAHATDKLLRIVEAARGFLRALLSLNEVEDAVDILRDLRTQIARGQSNSTEVLDRLTDVTNLMRGLPGAEEALKKLRTLYEYVSILEGELKNSDLETIHKGINDLIFYLTRKEVRSSIVELSMLKKPEVVNVKIVAEEEAWIARTPFFIGREPNSRRLCVRDAGMSTEVEVMKILRSSEELRLKVDLFPPVYVFKAEVPQSVSRLQAYIYASGGVLWMVATGRRPMRVIRKGRSTVETRGLYSGETIELGEVATLEIENGPRIELHLSQMRELSYTSRFEQRT